MDKIKMIILLAVPTTICNLKCRYCYLSQRESSFSGEQAQMEYSPMEVAKALSKERIGGTAFINICADGETLLTKNIDEYIYLLAKEGHYIEIVTNLTVTPVIDKILTWEKDILEHITFKCSFHYLQLKERNWLDRFSMNVNKIWQAGASANIEITPDDELIPYIDEVKEFSIANFGALPQLTIARDDNDKHNYLTNLTIDEYDKIWSQFNSNFWQFKKAIFNVDRKEFCYAGQWSVYINLATGMANQCYLTNERVNVFENIDEPIRLRPICKCIDTHCYNGHALLTLGLIPGLTTIGYGDIRDREREDGTHWIRPQMKEFLNSKLEESNSKYSKSEKRRLIINNYIKYPKHYIGKELRKLHILK